MTISLCMITKNEENYLRQCLSSVINFVDEIIIVDTGSTDKTKQIANEFNAKIYDFDWIDDFSAARNDSLKHSTKDWILVIDADEIIEENDLEKLRKLVDGINDGFALEQRSYLDNYFEGAHKNTSKFELIKDHPYYISSFIVRFFKNNKGIKFQHRVHELVEDSMKENGLSYEKTDIVIHHFGSLKEGGLISNKVEQYSGIILQQVHDEPGSARYNYQAARMYLGKKDFSNALFFFKKTADIDPHYKLVFSDIAKLCLQMNNKFGAIENFKKSMEQNSDNPSPANNLAVVLMSAGRFKEAKAVLEEQLRRHPNHPALSENYKTCLENL